MIPIGGEELLRRGLIAHTDAIASVSERMGLPGSRDPARVLQAHVLGGFDLEVIASRGFDIGRPSWSGQPISWTSPVRDARALDHPSGDAWLDRFTGGLLTTCGPRNIGAPQ